MSIRLEVTCETQIGDTLCLSGEDVALGAWDTSKALRLQASPSACSLWSVEIPVPAGGQFKFLVLRQSADVLWEPLESARCWPSTGLGSGALIRTKFGDAKMGVEASTAQLEAQARSFKDLAEKRRGSALEQDLDRKGANAYYYAHDRKFEVPEDAQVITGPGLITGGAPVLLEVGGQAGSEDDRIAMLKDYSWADSGAKVKVYVPLREGSLPAEGAEALVVAEYKGNHVEVTINSRPKQRLKIEKLNAEIVPESCTTRVEAKKDRVVLQLVKKRAQTTWFALTKAK